MTSSTRYSPTHFPVRSWLFRTQANWFRPLLVVLLAVAACHPLLAETEREKVQATILQKDAQFWEVYNRCDKEAFAQFFTDDVEFYHDRGGPTIGKENLLASLKNGLCGNENSHLRREAVEGTVQVFPLQKGDVTYAAVISGEHVFYVNDKGKPEYLDGHARFFQMWLLKDGVWKMSRITSYDHGPAAYVNSPMSPAPKAPSGEPILH